MLFHSIDPKLVLGSRQARLCKRQLQFIKRQIRDEITLSVYGKQEALRIARKRNLISAKMTNIVYISMDIRNLQCSATLVVPTHRAALSLAFEYEQGNRTAFVKIAVHLFPRSQFKLAGFIDEKRVLYIRLFQFCLDLGSDKSRGARQFPTAKRFENIRRPRRIFSYRYIIV